MAQEKWNFGGKSAHSREYNLVAHAEHRITASLHNSYSSTEISGISNLFATMGEGTWELIFKANTTAAGKNLQRKGGKIKVLQYNAG